MLFYSGLQNDGEDTVTAGYVYIDTERWFGIKLLLVCLVFYPIQSIEKWSFQFLSSRDKITWSLFFFSSIYCEMLIDDSGELLTGSDWDALGDLKWS